MVLRIRKLVSLGSLALVVSALLLLAGPLSGAASASPSPCKRWGNDRPAPAQQASGPIGGSLPG